MADEHERLRRELEHHRQRESELLALYETARDLTATRDVDRVLGAIVRRARQLLSADVGYLSIYDIERGDFYVRATEGSVSDDFAQIRVPEGVGICGLVAAEKRPHASSSYAADQRFLHSGRIDHGVLAEHIESLLGVPLLADDEVIGVLFVADRYPRTYSPQQIALLDSLAAFAAVAMENARLFQESREALERERHANAELHERTLEIQSAADVHERLSTLLASGGELDDLTDVVARELDGHVLVVDDGLRPLSWSGQTPETVDAELRRAFEHSREIGRSVHVPSREAWVASAGGLGGAEGGLVLWRSGPLTQSQVRTVERAAVMVALVLLARERVATAAHQAMQDLVTGLLTTPQRDPARLQREAERYGVQLIGELCVIVLHASAPSPHAVQVARGSLGTDGLAGSLDDDIVLVATGDDPESIAKRVQLRLRTAIDSPVTCAVSTADELAGLPDAYRRAARSVQLLLSLGRVGDLGTDTTLAPYALLFGEQGREDLGRFLDATLGRLIHWDRSRSADLTRTLLVYLDSGQSTAATAKALHIHPNTLRQRLERVAAVLPEWQDPTRVLEIHMALRLAALRADGALG
jgi:GAF domain-containing protein